MSNDFFLNGKYTQQQIDSLNKIKSKSASAAPDSKNDVAGNTDSIFKDIDARKSGSTEKTNNSDLFDYIDKIAGLNDFLNMLDTDGKDGISKEEISKLAGLDGDNKLTSKDIDAFIKEVKNLTSAKSITTSGNTTTEAGYKTDSTGKLIKNSQVSKDSKTGEVTIEYTFDDKGNVLTENNKKTNRTTTFTYDSNNNLKSSETRLNDSEKTLCSQKTYTMVNGMPVPSETKVYINASTGEKILDKDGNPTFEKFEYGYDSNGNQTTQKWYNKDGKLISDLTYTRDANGKVTGYKNAVDNSTVTYTFDAAGKRTGDKKTKMINGKEVEVRVRTLDEDGKAAEEIQKDENGKTTKKIKYNKNGSYASTTENGKTKIYDYDAYGLAQLVTEYDENDIGEDGKPKAGTEAISTTKYTDGIKTITTKKNGDKTFYKGGEIKTEIQGDKAYVYTRNSDGTKVKTTYNASDIDDKGDVKPGAKPSNSVNADESEKEKPDATSGASSSPNYSSATPADNDWGVFIDKGFDKDPSRLAGRKNVVIDGQDNSAETIKKIKANGTKVYSYLNIGSIENTREDYYNKYKKYALGNYDNWPDEKWMNVSKKEWQDFIVDNLAEKLLKKGCDGFWLDNLDVYEEYHKDEIYDGLVNIVTRLKEKGVPIYVNGGNKFVSRLIKEGKADLIDGVMQEEVFTQITDYDDNKSKKQDSGTQKEHLAYLERCKKAGIDVSVLEYTKDESLRKKIIAECKKLGIRYHVSKTVMLEYQKI